MMKNKITKYVVNGSLLAVMAAAGITVFQLGTSSSKDGIVQEEVQLESSLTEENPLIENADTSKVEAKMETNLDMHKVMDDEKEVDDVIEEKTSLGAEVSADGITDLEGVVLDEVTDVAASVKSLPELNFSENTLMEWPVNGHILLDYSMDQTTYFPTLDQYKLNPAIAVQAVEGAPVMASVEGTVFSIEEDVQTGTTVTMEIGNGFQAIYGQLRDLAVAEGDLVTKGTIIGYVDAPTKYYSREGSNVYFAMKENGKPVDPIAYLP